MKNLQRDILQEFVESERKRGCVRPKNLSDLERCPTDDEEEYCEESSCPVDRFLKKNKGLR